MGWWFRSRGEVRGAATDVEAEEESNQEGDDQHFTAVFHNGNPVEFAEKRMHRHVNKVDDDPKYAKENGELCEPPKSPAFFLICEYIGGDEQYKRNTCGNGGGDKFAKVLRTESEAWL